MVSDVIEFSTNQKTEIFTFFDDFSVKVRLSLFFRQNCI